MTAEVAILNRQAIALAADSAVTVTGPNGQKIFNTVNKLFMLSKYHPVGIMVYSSADVMNVPAETVIKVFRQSLERQSFASLEEYRDAFVTFLTDNSIVFPESARIDHARSVIFSVLDRLRSEIFRALIEKYPGAKEPSENEIRGEARSRLQSFTKRYTMADDLPNVTEDIRRRTKEISKPVVEYFKQIFKNQFSLTGNEMRSMYALASAVLLKSFPNDTETGFVIAGFGRDEMFPQLRSFQFETSLFGVTKMFEGRSADAGNGAGIVPFAQTEMMETFVEGRARNFDDFLEAVIENFFIQEKNAASNNPNKDDIHGILDVVYEGLIRKFRQSLSSFTRKYHIDPLVSTVASMPKEELAVMAEALINLTAIKRRASPDAETVGGPTDVAVISKGDGFVWIKRKHYFDGAINPHFGYNYNREDKPYENGNSL